MKFCTYRTDTGEIVRWTTHHEPPPEGCACGERDFDTRDGYIADGEFVPMPARPGLWATWDWASRGWVDPRTPQQALDEQWARVRGQRDRMLSATDWVVMRATERGEPTPEMWRGYRQALRDITQQPDPFAVEWPAPPSAA